MLGHALVYARALLPYAEVMESVAALPERSARKQRARYPDPPQHSGDALGGRRSR